jgi:flagellar hook assembly protein FlgD
LVLTLKSIITEEGGLENTTYLRCYPNPFDEKVTVEFAGTRGSVTIDVVNATGSVVKSIYNGYAVNGINTAVWDGNNQMGKNVSAGIYYIRFVSGDMVETVKISKTK